MWKKGHDVSHQRSKSIEDVGLLEDYHVVVTLSKNVEKHFLELPCRVVQLDWDINIPTKGKDKEEFAQEAYQEIYSELYPKIVELQEGLADAFYDKAIF